MLSAWLLLRILHMLKENANTEELLLELVPALGCSDGQKGEEKNEGWATLKFRT